MRFQPDPSSVIAAEIAFNRLAREKGQWTAFRETAAKDAVMFVPERTLAQAWLKGRKDPPRSVAWSPSIVFVSCDGALAASTGNWTRADDTVGYFTTIWRRDEKGVWKWVLDHGDTLAAPRPAPEFLTGKVATCKGRRGDRPVTDGPPPDGRRGKPPTAPAGGPMPVPSDDSLTWTADISPDGGRRVTVKMWTGESYQTVIDDRVGSGA
ncbi:MAG: hypothetical protein ABW039_13700 [Sphingobium sp.]